MMMTEKKYNEAKAKLDKIKKRAKKLREQILEYENSSAKPVFKTVKEIIDFIVYYPAEVGALFEYEGKTYKVGDYEEMEREYGSESMSYIREGDKTIDDLTGSWGLVELVKNEG